MSNPTLATAVQTALTQHTPLRVWAHAIDVTAQDSTITLTGIARNDSTKMIAERITRSVKGVSAVNNQIVTDDEVELAVAQALAAEARTRTSFPGILVGVLFGVTYLKGNVASTAIKATATEIASRIAGVQRVSNELSISV